MITKVELTVNADSYDSAIKEAADIIRAGGLVAFPTETVYGLGGDAMNENAAKLIYSAKGRPSDNPLIVHISHFEQLQEITLDLPDKAKILSDAFWPGPLTMVVKKNDKVPYTTTGGLDTVAVRMPNHPVALRLIRESGTMIAAPSANTSGRPSPTKASHVYEDLNGRIPLILDGGDVDIGVESTIVDLSEDKVSILRPGYITKDMLERALGEEVFMDPGLVDKNKRPKAPGMKYRHYAPKAGLSIVKGCDEAVVSFINEQIEHLSDKRVGVIANDDSIKEYKSAAVVFSAGKRGNDEEAAHNLFSILRSMDESEVDYIYSESFDHNGVGDAVMNRLMKAAGGSVIEV